MNRNGRQRNDDRTRVERGHELPETNIDQREPLQFGGKMYRRHGDGNEPAMRMKSDQDQISCLVCYRCLEQ